MALSLRGRHFVVDSKWVQSRSTSQVKQAYMDEMLFDTATTRCNGALYVAHTLSKTQANKQTYALKISGLKPYRRQQLMHTRRPVARVRAGSKEKPPSLSLTGRTPLAQEGMDPSESKM